MNVLRLVAIFIFGYLLTGCYLWGEHKSLKMDIIAVKALIRAHPSPTQCYPPGFPQARICNYSLVVDHVEGDFYRGYVNRAVVGAGEQACQRILKEFQEYYTDFECPKAKDYQYVWWGFKIEGAKPKADGKAHDFINIPETGSLKLDTTMEKIASPVATPIREEFK